VQEVPAEIGALCMNGSLITWTSFYPENVRRERRDTWRAASRYSIRHVYAYTCTRTYTDRTERRLCTALPAFYNLDAPARPRLIAMHQHIVSMPRLYTRHIASPFPPSFSLSFSSRLPPLSSASLQRYRMTPVSLAQATSY